MGMASFVDRIRDLLNDAMHFRGDWQARVGVATPEVTQPFTPDVQMRALAADLQKRIDAYGPLLDNIIRQLNGLLEYATDPALQLVEEVLRLRIARDSLSAQMARACNERDAIREEVTKMRSRVQEAHYAKRAAEATVDKIRGALAARVAAHEGDKKSLKGELAAKQRTHEETIEKLQRQHSAEMTKLRAAHRIEMRDLERRAELVSKSSIKSKDQSRQEEFAGLLPEFSSPRVPAGPSPIKKRNSNRIKMKR